MNIIEADDGRILSCTDKQLKTIEKLATCKSGVCGTVYGYIPTSNWKVSPVVDIQFITNFSVAKLYERKLLELSKIEFDNVLLLAKDDEKLKELSDDELFELFNKRKESISYSLNKSLDGSRDDSHRQAHDNFYAKFNGVKVHLKSEKIKGDTVLIKDEDENYIVDKIMIPYLEINRKIIKEGEKKIVNSGNPVRMGNLIERLMNSKSVDYHTLSLKEDNFERIDVQRKKILAEDVGVPDNVLI